MDRFETYASSSSAYFPNTNDAYSNMLHNANIVQKGFIT